MKKPIAMVLLLCAAGCGGGNWSNQDLEFLAALPQREELKSKLPVGESSSGLVGTRRDGLVVGDPSQVYADTKRSSDAFNALLDALLGLIDNVRRHPPTTRADNQLIWGPFADPNRPGYRVQVVMEKVDELSFTCRIELQRGEGEWFAVLTGAFTPSGAVREGRGTLQLLTKVMRDNGVRNDFGAVDQVDIGYITDLWPHRVDMMFQITPGDSSNLSQIGYVYREQEDRSGSIFFQLNQPSSPFITVSEVTSRWRPTGEGQAETRVTQGAYQGASQTECWDSGFIVVYQDQRWPGGNTIGDSGACAAVDGL